MANPFTTPTLPPNVTSTGTSQTTLPGPITGFEKTAGGLASQIATTPWQAFPGQLTAGPTSLQMNAAGMAPGAAGAYKPYFGAAAGAYGGMGGLTGQQTGLANTYGQMGLNAAFNPQNSWQAQAQNWMSPAIGNVVQQIANAGNQNFNTQLMPSINSQFIGSGDFNSLNNMNGLGLGAGLAQQGITSAQANALQGAYSQGMQGYLGQLGQQTGAANNAASAANTTGYMGNYGLSGMGSGMTGLGTGAANLGWSDVNNTMGLGSQFQNIGQNAINAQLGQFNQYMTWPNTQLQSAAGSMSGLPWPGTVSGTSNAPLAGAQYGGSPLAQAGTTLQGLTNLGNAAGNFAGGLSSWFGGGNAAPTNAYNYTAPPATTAADYGPLPSGGLSIP